MGKGGSKDPLVGEWENDKDTVVFNDDGTYSSYYYWEGNGQWSRIDGEDDKIEILHSLLGKEFHKVVIDGDDLELIQKYKGDDGSWGDTQMVYRFRRKGAPAKNADAEDSVDTVAEVIESETVTVVAAEAAVEEDPSEKKGSDITETTESKEVSEEDQTETDQEFPYVY